MKQFHKQTNFDFKIDKNFTKKQYWPKNWSEIKHKEYSRFKKIKLSTRSNLIPSKSLFDCLNERFSCREFSINKGLSFEELSLVLYYSAGVKASLQKYYSAKKGVTEKKVRRFYPSGGALYPLELYLVVNRVKQLEAGIYHYNVKENSLEQMSNDDELRKRALKGLYYQWSREAAVVFFITAVWERNFSKYQKRGYRIILLEAGHLAQNIALLAASLGIGCCNSLGFNNSFIDQILDIDEEGESSLYMAVLGKQ